MENIGRFLYDSAFQMNFYKSNKLNIDYCFFFSLFVYQSHYNLKQMKLLPLPLFLYYAKHSLPLHFHSQSFIWYYIICCCLNLDLSIKQFSIQLLMNTNIYLCLKLLICLLPLYFFFFFQTCFFVILNWSPRFSCTPTTGKRWTFTKFLNDKDVWKIWQKFCK